ncbi:hypothetical protein GCM10025876_27240 [Demequina litorisediminis]|uniref:Two-component sensor histidine kinase n=2 Tax=Demequina litorisediminis TaxID=1849022 RepID=A0ABQ6IF83_9MICO|nr:hypothetical protein GCM10025876_27240 [Demequina litorisediminis]
MSLRIVTTTLVIGIGTVMLLGAYATTQIRDGLVEDRVDRVLAESARDAATAQDLASSTTAANAADMQQFVLDLLIEPAVRGRVAARHRGPAFS